MTFDDAHVQVYVPNENSNWHATTSFSQDDIIEVSGTLVGLSKNTLSVCRLLLFAAFIKTSLIDFFRPNLLYTTQRLINQTRTTFVVLYSL